MIKHFILGMSCLFSLAVLAQNKQLENRIDQVSHQLIEGKKTAGVSILLLQDGQILYNKAFGYADVTQQTALKTDHIFRIASQTKAITSVAVMMLWEEGKILLDEPISKYIPAFKNPRVLDKFNATDSSFTTVASKREISIRDLLRHTSGISYPMIADDVRMKAIYTKAGIVTGIGNTGSLKKQIEGLAVLPLLHEPGYKFTYGLNTDVLGYLVEIVSGTTLADFLQQRIFDPLEMHDTYFRLPKEKAQRLVSVSEKTTTGFVKVGHAIYENSHVDYPLDTAVHFSGGAGLTSTTADYAKFLQMLLNNGHYKGKQIIGAKTVELMTTNQLPQASIAHGDPDFRFGLGFSVVTTDNKFANATSTGTFSWGGAFNTHYWVDPKEKIIGLVFTQEYMPTSYDDLGTVYKNVIYSTLPLAD